jgi:predicted DNA-binding mobile mystery protein A
MATIAASVVRKKLDRRFLDRAVADALARPRTGWVKAIREALGMTTAQLARRIGISQPAVVKLERAEADDRIQLGTLRRAADALDCELVYALVPRVSLVERIEALRDERAREEFARLDHTMALELQGDADEDSRAELKRRIRESIRDRDLWD